ncbi:MULTISPECIES: phosphoglycerate dehydrogenase [unclassified Breznakia]|uniref:phosphoglycerate dehydrogenase n=1 Tax=unclassified Breznakia TaxID=2623764 RepID=UPI0024768407|nr:MULTISPECIES: phosphoglycerate dehydrogenase [unclassified Breznakia]MDH6368014.1 phosphoglycerate dehydrogenase-like enzyme [Breznakia sp. PH1-1]MDH6405100.1 phosphoglycerate dehydrogenase-like enzyme [Breznakia sp. PF1-11]MDH6412817.1 phosphoglycerate dehydrogenase-like enzyme [Breznakia sp. PFB1-11]MDH6415177.1 phosphoglycerate dehydrogenase-like enzyme [Breznakia sp. PFB1-14]MDH6417488.1 phosphoglycerate dehydrogenase-like enzyme [Breznakia sp. PFB1-4]
MKVLITPRGFATYGLADVARLESKGFKVIYNDTGVAYTTSELLELAKDAKGIIVGVDDLSKEVLQQLPDLQAICKFGVGVDNIDLDYTKEKKIAVGRTVGSNSLSVAEHVVAMMFMDAKNLYTSVHEVKQGKWNKPTGYEIQEKKLGIIGFGMIGKHLARIANGLGMEVYANDVVGISKEDKENYQVKEVERDTILSTCDYVSLHIPLLPETRHSISTREFKMMKTSACLLNAARGGVVDEEALYEALIHKEIRSACFDVFSVEPPNVHEPLLKLDNFLLTPHTASRTVEAETRTCKMTTDFMLENIQRRS